jgi:cell division septal protein FtsQ
VSATYVAADRRFRRSHVKPSGRRRSRLRQAWNVLRTLGLVAIAGYSAWRGVATLATWPVLEVRHVEISGHERLSTGEVRALLAGLEGQHILALSLEDWQSRLRASPWVEEASLRRLLPSTIEVRVRERRPIAVGRLGSVPYLIDAHGAIVDEYGPAYADFDLPIVDGLGARQGRGPVIDEARVALAARVIAALGARPDLGRRVSQIDVSDPRDAVVMLEGDPTLLRLGDADFVARLEQYLDLGDALRERVAAIDYVDLRFAERVYVRPARGQKRSER